MGCVLQESWSYGDFRWMDEARSEHVMQLIEEYEQVIVDLKEKINVLKILLCYSTGLF